MNANFDLMHRCELVEVAQVAQGWFRLKLYAPPLTGAEPGQFIHLRAGIATDPLLRRPFSIHYVDQKAGEIWLLIRVVGSATFALSRLRPGACLDLLGPLGNTFPALEETAAPVLAAGGIGLAPLYFLARRRLEAGLAFDLLLGGAEGSSLPGDNFFDRVGLKPLLATEDGSRGFRGTVVDLLKQHLESGEKPARIHACGPLPMLARIVELGKAHAVPVHVSLESLMACAVGACLGCAFPFKINGKLEYRPVCRDGPVFNGEEADFNYV